VSRPQAKRRYRIRRARARFGPSPFDRFLWLQMYLRKHDQMVNSMRRMFVAMMEQE
jgi:hypothetical protein